MIRLLLIDADGTLVGKDRVHPRCWPALERARSAGLRLALCTGRPGIGASLALARRVDPEGIHVFQTGAILSRPDEPAVRIRELSRESLRALVAIARAEDVPLEAYGERRYFVERPDDLTHRHAEVLGAEPEIVDLLAVDEPLVRAQWVVHESRWPHFRALTEPIPDLDIHPGSGPWSPGTVFANLVRTGTSKADALRWLASNFGWEPAEVAMVGDAENDTDAMEAAGLGIAMGNAREAVQARADAVVGDVEDGALADAIELVLVRA